MVVVLETTNNYKIQLSEETLYTSDSIIICYDPGNKWIYAEWIGYQNLFTITNNGGLILKFLKEKNCTKILNNNQRVNGLWLDACNYFAEELLPQLTQSGLRFLAWVQSSSPFSQYSTEQTLEATCLAIKDQINIFYSLPVAKDWLKNV